MRITITAVSRIARHDGALDGRRTAPARKRGGMQVEAAEPRRGEDGFGQQQPVGDDDGGIGAESGERRCSGSPLRLAGVRTGMPALSAKRCTGDFCSAMPRPAGRGGCV